MAIDQRRKRPDSAGRGTVDNDDYRRLNGSASLGWSDQPGRSLRFDVRAGRHERGRPGPFGSDPLGLFPGIDLVSKADDRTSTMSASGVFFGAPRIRHRFQVGRMDDHEDRTTRERLVVEERTQRISAGYELAADERLLGVSVGTSLEYERADDSSIAVTGGAPTWIARTHSGIFGEARLNIRERLSIIGGARAERIERTALPANEDPPVPRALMPTQIEWLLLPKVSAGWFLRPADRSGYTKLRVSAGMGARPPSARQIANALRPRLQPEHSRSVDAGIEHSMLAHQLIVEADWFHNGYDDLIFAIATPAPLEGRYRTDNIARANASGVEIGAKWRGRNGLSADVAFTWLRTHVDRVDEAGGIRPPYRAGDELVRQPSGHGLAGMTWTSPRLRVFATVGGRSRIRDLEPNAAMSVFDNPGYATVAAGASVFVHPHLEIFVHATNLLDRSYEKVLGYPALGRAIQAGLRIAHWK